MNQSTAYKFAFSLLVCLAVLSICVAPVWAQSATTGGLTGTVTDPSGAVIVGATVNLTSLATGQARATTTDASGSYKFSLLSPGAYSVKFGAAGFKTSEVSSLTVSVTETPVLNQKLEVGAQSEQVTVEATAETVQTQSATVGTLVGAKTVTDLPLSSRNYTQIIDLSPGVVANVASAAAVGNGTQDINVNGFGSDQNNYMMDGATLTNYGSGGGAQSGNFPGIGIPNPDSIQEFKIQTSQYDAQYGRNPGASVNVVTKSGTNEFHGAAWEFFRNSFFDGNDFFNKRSEAQLQTANKPEALNENMFGGTIGGPVKKDKLFFFGSYQGFRQKNGIGTNGFATGLAAGVQLLPLNEPNGKRDDSGSGTIPRNYAPTGAPCDYNSYRTYLGCVFGGDAIAPFFPFGTHVAVANDGSNINQVAINMFQAPGLSSGLNGGFYFPSVPFGSDGLPVASTPQTLSVPILANEDQYLANADWVISGKNTLSTKFFTSKDPQNQSFVCLGFIGAPGVNNCDPGGPELVTYTADSATVKLTTLATSNFVNEALFSFQRSTTQAGPGSYLTACSVGITPPIANGNCASLDNIENLNPIPAQIPTFGSFGFPMVNANLGANPVPFSGGWNNGGNFFASATNFFNTFQYKDQISWNFGKHALRAGGEFDRIQYNWTLPGRGGLVFATIADMLTSASGLPGSNCEYGPGSPVCGPGSAVPGGLFINFYGLAQPNGNPHYQRTNEFSFFVEDDIKLTRRLTLNLGLRWEYDGYPSDKSGLFTDGWPTQAALVNTGSFFLGPQVANGPGTPSNLIGTLAGMVVQSNYDPSIARCGLPSAPVACGLTAPAGVYAGYPGGADGVFFNTNKTLVHGAPINAFGPRIGLAWQALDKFVVRAGYGVFYDAVYANLLANNNAGNAPYSGAVPFSPFNSLDRPSPAGLILGWRPRTLRVAAGDAVNGATSITDNGGTQGLGTTSDSEFLGMPMAQQYNLDLQYEFAKNWVADIGYVGSHGTHLYDWARPINISFLAPGAPNGPTDVQNQRMVLGSGAQGTPTSFPFNDPNNTNPATQIRANTGANAIGRVSYLGFGTGGLSTTNTIGDSLYNSLQLQLRHQFSHGLLVQASYTWSKLITNINSAEAGSGISAPGNVLSGGASSNDPLDFGQQYGLAAFNRPQRFILAYSYDLPYKNTQGLSGKLLGGWTVSGVTTIQDGEPFTITDGTAGTLYYGTSGVPFGGGGVRAELASPTNCNKYGVCQSAVPIATSGGVKSRLGLTDVNGVLLPGQSLYADPTAFVPAPCIGGYPNPGGGSFAQPCGDAPNGLFPGDPGYPFIGAGTGFGNSPIGSIMGPGQNNWDFTAIKNTKITEGLTVQVRAEFYNLWNHSQFNPPVNARNNGFFGRIFSSSVPPRVVQFALKFSF